MIYLSQWECKHTLILIMLMSLNLKCYDSTQQQSLGSHLRLLFLQSKQQSLDLRLYLTELQSFFM